MTGVQTCALPICFPVTIGFDEEDGDWDSLSDYVSEAQEQREMIRLNREVSKFKTVL